LKAQISLLIEAPTEWVVLSNEIAEPIQNLAVNSQKYQLVRFPKTKLIPTYIFGIVAGPFEYFPNTAVNYKSIPLHLGCRKSLKVHLDKMKEFIFEVTNKAMEFFENFFGCPY